MRRRQFIMCSAAALLIAAIVSGSAFAQGSTGGSIGKRDKAVSGGDSSTGTERRSRPEDQAKNSVSGLWHWSCDCASGNSFRGTFNFTQTGTNFTGTTTQQGGSGGSVPDGRISGNRVSFTVMLDNLLKLNERWTGALNGQRIQGSLTTKFEGACTFTANRRA